MTTTTTTEPTAHERLPGGVYELVTEDIRQVTEEAEQMLATFVPFAERVGAVMTTFEDLLEGTQSDAFAKSDGVDLREVTGYDRLMDVCWQLLSHASAAADQDPGCSAAPDWYVALEARRDRAVRERSEMSPNPRVSPAASPTPTPYEAALAAAPVWLNLSTVVDEDLVREVTGAAEQVEALREAVTAASQRAYLASWRIEETLSGQELGDDVYVLVRQLIGGERLWNAVQAISDDTGCITGSCGEPDWLADFEARRKGTERDEPEADAAQ